MMHHQGMPTWCIQYNTKHLVLLLQSCTFIELASQGGDLRQALQSSEGKQQLHWYKKGSAIALDIIKGLHFLHSHSVSLAIHTCSLQNPLARYIAKSTALRRISLEMTKQYGISLLHRGVSLIQVLYVFDYVY